MCGESCPITTIRTSSDEPAGRRNPSPDAQQVGRRGSSEDKPRMPFDQTSKNRRDVGEELPTKPLT